MRVQLKLNRRYKRGVQVANLNPLRDVGRGASDERQEKRHTTPVSRHQVVFAGSGL